MPEQDSWKKELKKEFSKFSNRPEFFSHEKHVIVTGMAEVISTIIIESLLSYQAHALKEQMKAKLETLKVGVPEFSENYLKGCEITIENSNEKMFDAVSMKDIHNETINEALSAIESMEI